MTAPGSSATERDPADTSVTRRFLDGTARAFRRDRQGEGEERVELKVVRHPHRAPISTYTLGGISVLIIVIAFVATVFVRVRLAEGQQRVDTLTEEIGELGATAEDLELQIAQLEAPDRIRAVASTRLRMVSPTDVLYLAPVLPDRPETALLPPVGDPFALTESDEDIDEDGQ